MFMQPDVSNALYQNNYLFAPKEQPLHIGWYFKWSFKLLPQLLNFCKFTQVVHLCTSFTIHCSDLDPHDDSCKIYKNI